MVPGRESIRKRGFLEENLWGSYSHKPESWIFEGWEDEEDRTQLRK